MSLCPPPGPGVLEYVLHTEEHKCKKDTLLGRIKHSPDKSWKLIRPRPTKTQYVGPYYICKGGASPSWCCCSWEMVGGGGFCQ